MPNLRPVTITDNPLSSWQNLVQKTVQSQTVVGGDGIRISSNDGNFTRITAPDDLNVNHLVWRGDWNEFDEYRVNDVVRVNPNVPYTDPDTAEKLPIGSTTVEGYSTTPLSLGLFVCVAYVPPSWADVDYFQTEVVPNFPSVIPYTYQTGIRWTAFNVYYPIYPEIPLKYTSSVDSGYGFQVTANQTFWQALPMGVQPMNVCIDGKARTFYVIGAESGSVFKEEYLPYVEA